MCIRDRLGIGLNKAIYNLRSYGIDSQIIDRCLEAVSYTHLDPHERRNDLGAVSAVDSVKS